MKASAALAGGLAGTLAVASIHEALKRITPDAPRMDVLDIELIRKGLKRANIAVPPEDELQRWAVGVEAFCDTTYYSVVGMGDEKGVWARGALLGLVAGVSAIFLPKPLGLPQEPSNKTVGTQLMTMGLYLVGGLAAAGMAHLININQGKQEM